MGCPTVLICFQICCFPKTSLLEFQQIVDYVKSGNSRKSLTEFHFLQLLESCRNFGLKIIIEPSFLHVFGSSKNMLSFLLDYQLIKTSDNHKLSLSMSISIHFQIMTCCLYKIGLIQNVYQNPKIR